MTPENKGGSGFGTHNWHIKVIPYLKTRFLWAVTGLHLLEKDATPAQSVLEQALMDEAHEARIMAAWTLIKLGETGKALASLDELLIEGTPCRELLHNVLDWMGEPGFPLVRRHLERGDGKNGRYGTGILPRIGELQGW